MPTRQSLVIVFVVALSLFLSTSAAAHHSRVSLTEIEWNTDSQRFEVAMRLRISDLEDAVSAERKSRFRMEGNPQRDKLIQDYMAKHFSIMFADHRKCRLHWLGCELELHDVWIYVEVESIATASVTQQAVVDKAADSNHVKRWQDLFGGTASASKSADQQTRNSSVVVRHTALMDVHPDQTNVVSLTRNRQVKTLTLSRLRSSGEFQGLP